MDRQKFYEKIHGHETDKIVICNNSKILICQDHGAFEVISLATTKRLNCPRIKKLVYQTTFINLISNTWDRMHICVYSISNISNIFSWCRNLFY